MDATSNSFSHPVSRLVLEVFRLNGALIAAGDALVAPLGLTSARWQVMGAVVEARGSLPVAGIARTMGLVRQSVQRIADELAEEGILRFVPNPHHRRAKLMQITDKGAAVFEAASTRWLALADALAAALPTGEPERVAAVLHLVREQLQAPNQEEETP
ncbi:MarR family transcriptional regulator [Rhodovastum atsumiense]|uniref:MarR family transcriptional regulator n=1 Tax=Rhodovastum atsumiense TaxID=504468 RepID=A0A5M6INF4_9PROT|nr:MarR family transcriptional regulator [Rhodovastum atsumiense]KAA5609781.1 MarR family transcriptional regulator [Rhodovastum atsumiense]CAH2599438.1 MarR family transcriptional regulator [Rhodovastum atsumiense]